MASIDKQLQMVTFLCGFFCIYLFLAVLDLHCSLAFLQLWRVWASHCSGFSSCGAQALGFKGFSSCGSWAPETRFNSWEQGLSCSAACAVFPDQRVNPCLLHQHIDSLPSEPIGKPKNTGVGSLFLLQGIFPTQKQSTGLLHCRQILYHLSHQGSLLLRNISKYEIRST